MIEVLKRLPPEKAEKESPEALKVVVDLLPQVLLFDQFDLFNQLVSRVSSIVSK